MNDRRGPAERWAGLAVLLIIVVPVAVTIALRLSSGPAAFGCSTFGMSC